MQPVKSLRASFTSAATSRLPAPLDTTENKGNDMGVDQHLRWQEVRSLQSCGSGHHWL